MVLTRSKSRCTEAHLPEELVVCILSRMAEGQTSAYNVASDLRSCALVCSMRQKAVAVASATASAADAVVFHDLHDVVAVGGLLLARELQNLSVRDASEFVRARIRR